MTEVGFSYIPVVSGLRMTAGLWHCPGPCPFCGSTLQMILVFFTPALELAQGLLCDE